MVKSLSVLECDSDTGFHSSRKILVEVGYWDGERARTLRAWARQKIRLDERQRGLEMWRKAGELFARLGTHMEVARMMAAELT